MCSRASYLLDQNKQYYVMLEYGGGLRRSNRSEDERKEMRGDENEERERERREKGRGEIKSFEEEDVERWLLLCFAYPSCACLRTTESVKKPHFRLGACGNELHTNTYVIPRRGLDKPPRKCLDGGGPSSIRHWEKESLQVLYH